jgi:hypothetical protein
MPGVLEGQQLGIGGIARLVAEDDVVVAIGVEGRVELNQVDGGSGLVATQDVEVVAVGEDVGGEGGHRSPREDWLRWAPEPAERVAVRTSDHRSVSGR